MQDQGPVQATKKDKGKPDSEDFVESSSHFIMTPSYLGYHADLKKDSDDFKAVSYGKRWGKKGYPIELPPRTVQIFINQHPWEDEDAFFEAIKEDIREKLEDENIFCIAPGGGDILINLPEEEDVETFNVHWEVDKPPDPPDDSTQYSDLATSPNSTDSTDDSVSGDLKVEIPKYDRKNYIGYKTLLIHFMIFGQAKKDSFSSAFLGIPYELGVTNYYLTFEITDTGIPVPSLPGQTYKPFLITDITFDAEPFDEIVTEKVKAFKEIYNDDVFEAFDIKFVFIKGPKINLSEITIPIGFDSGGKEIEFPEWTSEGTDALQSAVEESYDKTKEIFAKFGDVEEMELSDLADFTDVVEKVHSLIFDFYEIEE